MRIYWAFRVYDDISYLQYHPSTNGMRKMLRRLAHKFVFVSGLLCGLVCCSHVHAQLFSSYQFKFHTYTANDGLVHNSVKKCLEDKKGFLWLITENGLSRFDGVQFKNFQNETGDPNSLPYNDLNDIAIDAKSDIWLASEKGLFCYETKARKFRTIPIPGNDAEVQTATYDARTNRVWFCTRKKLYYLEPGKTTVHETSYKREIPAQGKIYPSLIDSKQRLWLPYMRLGYVCYDTRVDTFHIYQDAYWVTSINEDKEGKIWLSTWDQGLQVFGEKAENKIYVEAADKGGQSASNIFFGSTEAPGITPANILWVITNTDGICLFDKDKNRFIQKIGYDPVNKSGLTTNFNWHIYSAPDSTLWVCTWQGLTKVNRYEQQFFSAEISELNNKCYNLITGIADDPSDTAYAWMAAEGNGLLRYNKKLDKPVRHFYNPTEGTWQDHALGEPWVNGLVMDDDKKTIWANTFRGLVRIRNGKPVYFPFNLNNATSGSPRKIVCWKNKLLIAGWRSVVLFDPENGTSIAYQNGKNALSNVFLPENRFSDMLAIGENDFICASQNGLYNFNAVTHMFTAMPFNIQTVDSVATKRINCLERVGNLVFAATVGGLVEYNINTHQARMIGREQKIFKLLPSSILKDNSDNLWIYTSHGLFLYDTHTKNFEKFTTKDGLYNNSDDPVKMFSYKSNIYIGYRMAYTRFDPNKMHPDLHPKNAFITDVFIKGDSLLIDTDTPMRQTLRYDQNNFIFNFTATDYGAQKIVFSYRLKGFDSNWVTTTTRTAAFNNLRAGSYVFEVSTDPARRTVAAYLFRIRPPFWQTPWFILLMSVLLVTVLITAIKTRIRFIRKQADEKTMLSKQLSELEIKALRSQMNPHFIFNSLNSIQKFIWANRQEEASEYLNRFSRLMRLTLDNSMNKYVLLEKEMETIDLYLELEHRRSNNKFDYTVRVADNLKLDTILIQPMLIQPYLENSIWHGLLPSRNRGKLELNVSKKNEHFLYCEIIDNGIGRKLSAELNARKQKTSLSYGMKLTEDRLLFAGEHGITGKVWVEDLHDENGEAAGTKVHLEIPVEFFQKIG